MTTDISAPCLTLTTPADVLAAVPYLVGFHPSDSLIVVGLTDGKAKVTARWNVPMPAGTLAPMAALLEREKLTQVVIVGYGPGDAVTPAVDEAIKMAASANVEVADALRAHDGRYWSYVCDSASCCPPEGTPYDPKSSRVAAEATVRGLVALPDRQTLQSTIAPVTGPARLSMRRATAEAVHDLRAALNASTDPDDFAQSFVTEGLARVRAALATTAAGDRLDDAEAARLGLDLAVVRIRDEAWTLMNDSHLPLWKDLTRRLEPAFVPPAASLLAMAGWCGGDSILATIALERALTIDPHYSMANLLMHALQHLLPPSVLAGRMPSPDELDAAMGTPQASWLRPLLGLIDHNYDAPPDTLSSDTLPSDIPRSDNLPPDVPPLDPVTA